MSDDISLFHRRMRKPAIISVVAGLGLGFLAIGAHRMTTGNQVSWLLAFAYGGLAAIMLYGVTYRNLKRRLEHSELGDDNRE